MKQRQRIGALAVAAGLALASAHAGEIAAEQEQRKLPSAECLQLQREARIALMRSKHDEMIAKLEQAVEYCERKTGPLAELVRMLRGMEGREEELERARSRLIESLEEIDAAGHPAVLSEMRRVLSDENVEGRTLRLVTRTLERFVEAREDVDPEVLDVLLAVQLRIGDKEGVRKTLSKRLPSADPTEELNVWMIALNLDVEAERWEAVLERIGKLPPPIRESSWMRALSVRALGALGRHEEMLERAAPLLAPERAFQAGSPGPAPVDLQRKHTLEQLKQAAWRLYDEGKEETSERMFRKLAGGAPQDEEVQAVLAHLFVDEEQRRSRATALDQQWRQSNDAQALLEEGSARLSAGDPKGAYPLLVRATALAPSSDIAWYNRGLAALGLERWADAEEAFTKVLALSPGMIDAAYSRAQARVHLEKFERALEDLDRVVRQDPERKAPWYYVYKCHTALGNEEQAQAALKRYQGD